MAEGIKIINILKGDSFEEVFEEFKKAQAHEVILIFPKNSRIAKDEEHFASLASAAQNSEKTVTIMTADEAVRGYSQKYGFKFLASPGKGSDQEEEVDLDEVETPDVSTGKEDVEDTEDEEEDGDDKDKNDGEETEEDEDEDEDKEEETVEPEEEEEEDEKSPEENFKEEEWEETPSE